MVSRRRCPRPSGCNAGGHVRLVRWLRFLLLIWAATWAELLLCHAVVPEFPKPTTSWGNLHTLPIFHCEEHYPRMVNGSRGLDYKSAGPGARHVTRHIVLGAHTCAVPLGDLSAINGSLVRQRDGNITVGSEVVRKDRTATLRTADLVRGRYVQDTQYFPQARDGGGPTDALFPSTRHGLVYEAALGRTLALQRNSYAGSVYRVTRLYDVLAVSRLTLGVCMDPGCTHTAAVDTVGGGVSNWGRPGKYEEDDAHKVVLLTMPTAKSGSRATVSMMDSAVLSLGYRAMVDRGWLSRPPADGGVHAWPLSGLLILFRPRSSTEAIPGALTSRHYAFGGNHTADKDNEDPSMWLQSLAYILCQSPTRSFLTNPGRMCSGVPPVGGTPPLEGIIEDQRSNVLPGVVPTSPWKINGRRAPESPALPRRLVFRWDVDPYGNVTLEDCGDIGHSFEALRPAWLAGATSREINPASSDEVALGRSLGGSCLSTIADGAGKFQAQARLYSVGTPPQDFGEVDAVARELAQEYVVEAFGVDPPGAPSSTAAILLAVIVILPEALGVAVLAVEPRRWNRRAAAVLVLVFATGAISMAGIVYQAVEEVRGAAWRAGTVRDQVAVEVPTAVNDARHAAVQDRTLTGLLIVRSETTFVVARTGFRPGLVVWVAAGTAACYAALSIAAGVAAGVAARRQRTGMHVVQTGGGRQGGGAAAAAAEAAAARATARGGGGGVIVAARGSLNRTQFYSGARYRTSRQQTRLFSINVRLCGSGSRDFARNGWNTRARRS
ncbi:hypothetical protein BU14_0436s0005 [Porphyra umbilicalis]|uniref:Uncharacterized protein n=1 Tax=Porphyra umbilicalis TaxID=2786 RepID=A0A1X6NVN7_PORUM|nr:hypothetical protein BU14_0436s0005 [Porphyra umbilicalis]|eukprot:OSX72433.1 hypothetical protein BU14_0436s0005 [Porphyra umbilicalis]